MEELRAIQAACKLFCPEYNPGITIVIVQKRHHTRFFPVNPKDQVGSLSVCLSVCLSVGHI